MAIYYAGSAKRRAEVVGKPAAGWELSRKVDPKAKTSSKRAEANRRNAQKSTGPRTAEGKDRSNAVAHGLTARSELRPGEDPRELLERRRSLLDDLKPRNQLEALQIERIATDVDVITPLKAIAEADAAEAPLRMAFELGPEGEAHRRYVLANERLANRTIGEFLKIRKMSEAGFLDGDSSVVRGSSPLVDCQGDAIEVPASSPEIQASCDDNCFSRNEAILAAVDGPSAAVSGEDARLEAVVRSAQDDAGCDDNCVLRNEAISFERQANGCQRKHDGQDFQYHGTGWARQNRGERWASACW